MDIPRQYFNYYLPSLLSAIADSHFVSIDLEFSGIASKSFSPKEGSKGGRQTLQQRYQETKEAAERYQVLQVGLTCASEDPVTGGYVLRPYNFHINPVMEERLDLERIWSYQGSAVEFLFKNGFQFDVPFREGVGYLSRAEEDRGKQVALERLERSRTIANMDVREDEIESLQFLEVVRRQVNEWLAQGTKREGFVNVPPPSSGTLDSSQRSLNNFQKRLVHQLVRAEYPQLVSISRPTFVQIVEFDQAREDGLKADHMKRVEERICRQTGFRWLVEGLCGGNLMSLDPKSLVADIKSPHPEDEDNPVRHQRAISQFTEARDRLKLKRAVMVGHNVFTDLIYFYTCFFGPLPDRVEDFQKTIHELFPIVIDTKYLATHNCGSINPKSSLEDIDATLAKVDIPGIVTHEGHDRYMNGGYLHEAGYDSFLTARVLIKLSVQLHRQGEYLREMAQDPSSDEDYFTPPEGDDLESNITIGNGEQPGNQFQARTNHSPSSSELPVLEDANEVSLMTFDESPIEQRVSLSSQDENTREGIMPRLAHATKFDVLKGLAENALPAPLTKKKRRRQKKRKAKSPHRSLLDEPPTPLIRDPDNFMPTFGDPFWKVYGNKLRVFGTVESLCTLSVT